MRSYYVTINLETKDYKVNKIITCYCIVKRYTKMLVYTFAMLSYVKKTIIRFGLPLPHLLCNEIVVHIQYCIIVISHTISIIISMLCLIKICSNMQLKDRVNYIHSHDLNYLSKNIDISSIFD